MECFDKIAARIEENSYDYSIPPEAKPQRRN